MFVKVSISEKTKSRHVPASKLGKAICRLLVNHFLVGIGVGVVVRRFHSKSLPIAF